MRLPHWAIAQTPIQRWPFREKLGAFSANSSQRSGSQLPPAGSSPCRFEVGICRRETP